MSIKTVRMFFACPWYALRVVEGGHVWFDLEVGETPTSQLIRQFSRSELDGAL